MREEWGEAKEGKECTHHHGLSCRTNTPKLRRNKGWFPKSFGRV